MDERWRCINGIDVQAFGDQNLGDGETRPTAQIKYSCPTLQRAGPVTYSLYTDAPRVCTATTRQKLHSDTFVSVGSIHHELTFQGRYGPNARDSYRYWAEWASAGEVT